MPKVIKEDNNRHEEYDSNDNMIMILMMKKIVKAT